ncbi:hypothetical protein POM88_021824 [Heracleum sosnowskyi]|uniref:Poly(A) polymerase nucleotidyltransferase domain-containing protein n=1 Tax=Heracleum sosnowskyi TaxID=360622 RepID=A0AAD8IFL6_9APIA|nr:hypothetical protein POM88_021824 [Heracleum sosnowskyi]
MTFVFTYEYPLSKWGFCSMYFTQTKVDILPLKNKIIDKRTVYKFLVDADLYECHEESIVRKEVLGRLDQIVKIWVKTISCAKGLNEPYRLGVHGPGADVDTLCVEPRHADRDSVVRLAMLSFDAVVHSLFDYKREYKLYLLAMRFAMNINGFSSLFNLYVGRNNAIGGSDCPESVYLNLVTDLGWNYRTAYTARSRGSTSAPLPWFSLLISFIFVHICDHNPAGLPL